MQVGHGTLGAVGRVVQVPDPRRRVVSELHPRGAVAQAVIVDGRVGILPREGPDAVIERGGAVAGAAGRAGHGAEDRVAAVVAADRLGDEPAQAEVRMRTVAGLTGGGGTAEEVHKVDNQTLDQTTQNACANLGNNKEKASERYDVEH